MLYDMVMSELHQHGCIFTLSRKSFIVWSLCSGEVLCNLEHVHAVSSVCMLHKILSIVAHCVHCHLPTKSEPSRNTLLLSSAHLLSFWPMRCHTNQVQQSFLPNTIHIGNFLDGEVCAG